MNSSLRDFTSEKDSELKAVSSKYHSLSQDNQRLQVQLDSEKERTSALKQELERKVTEFKKRNDRLIKNLADHEKCETIR